MARRKSKLAVGDLVQVATAGKDPATYELTHIFPDGDACLLREAGLAPNGKPYAEQRYILSNLVAARA